MLQAQHILYVVIDEGLVLADVKRGLCDKENSPLTRSGSHFCKQFAKSLNILRTQTPPEGCIGGPWQQPLIWLSNMLEEWSEIDVYSAKEAVEQILSLMTKKGQEAGMGL